MRMTLDVFKPEGVVEVRAIGKATLSGYFKDRDALLNHVLKYPNDTWYFVMNGIKDACYSR